MADVRLSIDTTGFKAGRRVIDAESKRIQTSITGINTAIKGLQRMLDSINTNIAVTQFTRMQRSAVRNLTTIRTNVGLLRAELASLTIPPGLVGLGRARATAAGGGAAAGAAAVGRLDFNARELEQAAAGLIRVQGFIGGTTAAIARFTARQRDLERALQAGIITGDQYGSMAFALRNRLEALIKTQDAAALAAAAMRKAITAVVPAISAADIAAFRFITGFRELAAAAVLADTTGKAINATFLGTASTANVAKVALANKAITLHQLGRSGGIATLALNGLVGTLRAVKDSAVLAFGPLSGVAARATNLAKTITNGRLAFAAYATSIITFVITAFSAVNAAKNFEVGLVGVAKTTNISNDALQIFGDQLLALSSRIGISAVEIANIAQAAGQLGVRGSRALLAFTETVAKLTRSTDLGAQEAATALARLLNTTGESFENVTALGSVITALGNQFAATESEILDAATEVGRIGGVFGLTSFQAAALGAALKDTGAQSAAAGTAVGRVLATFDQLAREGGLGLQRLAEITGTSMGEIADIIRTDIGEAFRLFLNGLAQIEDEGGSAAAVLSEFGLTGVREAKSLLPLITRVDDTNRAFRVMQEEVKNTTALEEEFNRFSSTLSRGLETLGNRIKNVFITAGGTGLPTITALTNAFSSLFENSKNVATGLNILLGSFLAFLAIKAVVGIVGLFGVTLSAAAVPMAALIGIGAAVVFGLAKFKSGVEEASEAAARAEERFESVGKTLKRANQLIKEAGELRGFDPEKIRIVTELRDSIVDLNAANFDASAEVKELNNVLGKFEKQIQAARGAAKAEIIDPEKVEKAREEFVKVLDALIDIRAEQAAITAGPGSLAGAIDTAALTEARAVLADLNKVEREDLEVKLKLADATGDLSDIIETLTIRRTVERKEAGLLEQVLARAIVQRDKESEALARQQDIIESVTEAQRALTEGLAEIAIKENFLGDLFDELNAELQLREAVLDALIKKQSLGVQMTGEEVRAIAENRERIIELNAQIKAREEFEKRQADAIEATTQAEQESIDRRTEVIKQIKELTNSIADVIEQRRIFAEGGESALFEQEDLQKAVDFVAQLTDKERELVRVQLEADTSTTSLKDALLALSIERAEATRGADDLTKRIAALFTEERLQKEALEASRKAQEELTDARKKAREEIEKLNREVGQLRKQNEALARGDIAAAQRIADLATAEDLLGTTRIGTVTSPGVSRLPIQFTTPEGRPLVMNSDGSISTEVTATVTDQRINQGMPTNIPTVFDGQFLSVEEAINRIAFAFQAVDPETGRFLESFESIEAAVAAAEKRSASFTPVVDRMSDQMKVAARAGLDVNKSFDNASLSLQRLNMTSNETTESVGNVVGEKRELEAQNDRLRSIYDDVNQKLVNFDLRVLSATGAINKQIAVLKVQRDQLREQGRLVEAAFKTQEIETFTRANQTLANTLLASDGINARVNARAEQFIALAKAQGEVLPQVEAKAAALSDEYQDLADSGIDKTDKRMRALNERMRLYQGFADASKEATERLKKEMETFGGTLDSLGARGLSSFDRMGKSIEELANVTDEFGRKIGDVFFGSRLGEAGQNMSDFGNAANEAAIEAQFLNDVIAALNGGSLEDLLGLTRQGEQFVQEFGGSFGFLKTGIAGVQSGLSGIASAINTLRVQGIIPMNLTLNTSANTFLTLTGAIAAYRNQLNAATTATETFARSSSKLSSGTTSTRTTTSTSSGTSSTFSTLQSLNDVSGGKSFTFPVRLSGSPELPFTEYMERYIPSVVNDTFARIERTAALTLPVRDASGEDFSSSMAAPALTTAIPRINANSQGVAPEVLTALLVEVKQLRAEQALANRIAEQGNSHTAASADGITNMNRTLSSGRAGATLTTSVENLSHRTRGERGQVTVRPR